MWARSTRALRTERLVTQWALFKLSSLKQPGYHRLGIWVLECQSWTPVSRLRDWIYIKTVCVKNLGILTPYLHASTSGVTCWPPSHFPITSPTLNLGPTREPNVPSTLAIGDAWLPVSLPPASPWQQPPSLVDLNEAFHFTSTIPPLHTAEAFPLPLLPFNLCWKPVVATDSPEAQAAVTHTAFILSGLWVFPQGPHFNQHMLSIVIYRWDFIFKKFYSWSF